MNNNGLSERDIKAIHGIFRKYPSIKLVHIFGSRAKGTYKPGSDIDFAVMNEGVNDEIIAKIKGEFEESSLPYMIDIVNYPLLQHNELKEHIERVGIEFYNHNKN